MTATRTHAAFALGAALFTAMMFWSGDTTPSTPADLVSQAEARVGRPLTPVSYAGVARRTTRRTVAYTGAATAAAVAATPTTVVVAAPPPTTTCAEVTDAAGNVVKTCTQ